MHLAARWIMARIALLVGVVSLSFPLLAASSARADQTLTLLGRPLERGGFHFEVAFGLGGGPTSGGLLHSMEIGYTLRESKITIAYNHVFILSDGFAKIEGGPDMFGGHMLLFKKPILFPNLLLKAAVGLGESVDLQDGFKPSFGFGCLYGLDFDLPLTSTSGFTLGAISVHAVTKAMGHQWGLGPYLAYTWF
jgi:hypothetical protein